MRTDAIIAAARGRAGISHVERGSQRAVQNTSACRVLFDRCRFPAGFSILHRISGLLLFFPLTRGCSICLIEPCIRARLRARPRGTTSGWRFAKLVSLLFVWAYSHHFCAGILFLFLRHRQKGIALRPPAHQPGRPGGQPCHHGLVRKKCWRPHCLPARTTACATCRLPTRRARRESAEEAASPHVPRMPAALDWRALPGSDCRSASCFISERASTGTP